MKQIMAIACAAMLSSLLISPTHADSTAAVRKTLQAIYNRVSVAISHKDILGATAFDTPNYVTIDDQGNTHTLAETQERAYQLFKRPQIVKSTTHVDKITLQGNNAMAETKQYLHMKYTNSKTHHVFLTEQVSTATDTWVKQGTTWRRARHHTRAVQVSVNGRMQYSSYRPKPAGQ